MSVNVDDQLPALSLEKKTIEQEILSHIQQAQAFGSRKKRKEEQRGTQVCRAWQSTGECKFGDECKFAHHTNVKATSDEMGRMTLREMGSKRARMSVSAAVLSSDVAADKEGDGQNGTRWDQNGDSNFEMLPAVAEKNVTSLSFVLKYFTRLYAPDCGGVRGRDQGYYIQSNKSCIITLAPSHPILRGSRKLFKDANGQAGDSGGILTPSAPTSDGIATESDIKAMFTGKPLKVVKVEFSKELQECATKGKRKRGQVFIEPHQIIAIATTEDGREWPIYGGIRGGVVELNKRLETEPWLLSTKPGTAGYIAIILLQLHRIADISKALLTQDQYEQLCSIRGVPYDMNALMG